MTLGSLDSDFGGHCKDCHRVNKWTSKVRVNKSEYLWSHGMNPRGTGSWIFEVGTEMLTFHGSYSFAKKEAQKFAKNLGLSEVKVLP